MSRGVPSGWTVRPSAYDPSAYSPASIGAVLSRESNVGLYDGDTDLRHLGQGELILTPILLALSFLSVQPDPSLPAINNSNNSSTQQQQQQSKTLHLEMPLSSISMIKAIGGFSVFSSPKIQILPMNPTLPMPRLSFRNGGEEFFFKQLDQALKKKAWLSMSPTSIPLSTSAAAASGGTNGASSPPSSMPSRNNNNNNTNDTTSFSTMNAGIAGVITMQERRADALKQSIKGATTQVDELVVKGKELSLLMAGFREEVAKGNYKLIDAQLEQLKRIDSRLAATTANAAFNISNRHLLHASNPKSANNSSSVNNATPHELATDLVQFIRSDPVLCHTVRVPLVELHAAHNIFRGFSFEISPMQFHAGLCELARNFPERRFSLKEDDPHGCETVPSFALRADHLIQCHVMASLVLALEKVLGPRPTAECSVSSSSSMSRPHVLPGVSGSFSTCITAIQFSKLVSVPLDEAQVLLLMLEIHEGVLARDEHGGGGNLVAFYWNVFCFV